MLSKVRNLFRCRTASVEERSVYSSASSCAFLQSCVLDLSFPGGHARLGGDLQLRVRSKSKLQVMHSVQSYILDPCSLGEIPVMVLTAVQYSISCRMSCRYKPPMRHMLQSWAMDPSPHWALAALVAAAVQYRTSCEMRSRSKLTRGICSKFGAMDQSSPGAVPVLVTLAILGSRKMCNRSKLRGVHLLQSYALEIVLQIQASLASFAAILGGASVLTWARARFGGDSTSLQEQLRDCSHSKLHMLHSLQSCAMDLSSPTTVPALLMTAVQYRSSRECATVPGFQWRVGCNPGYWSMSCRSRLVRPAANVRPLYNLHCGTCCNPG